MNVFNKKKTFVTPVLLYFHLEYFVLTFNQTHRYILLLSIVVAHICWHSLKHCAIRLMISPLYYWLLKMTHTPSLPGRSIIQLFQPMAAIWKIYRWFNRLVRHCDRPPKWLAPPLILPANPVYREKTATLLRNGFVCCPLQDSQHKILPFLYHLLPSSCTGYINMVSHYQRLYLLAHYHVSYYLLSFVWRRIINYMNVAFQKSCRRCETC